MYTDDDRRTLLEALETKLGHRPAEILMSHLPPVGWVDLATKADIAATKADIAELRAEMKLQFSRMVLANVLAVFAGMSLVLAAASFLR